MGLSFAGRGGVGRAEVGRRRIEGDSIAPHAPGQVPRGPKALGPFPWIVGSVLIPSGNRIASILPPEGTPAMDSRARKEYRYEKLTWPEINDAIELGKVCLVPCGAVEQHGAHLPLDVDLVCPLGIAHGAGREIADRLLVLPIIAYGYTGHVMDFPGTINTDYEHFMHQVLDVTKSLAYHGFKKIILFNGHGSNWPNLDLVGQADQSGDRRGVHTDLAGGTS